METSPYLSFCLTLHAQNVYHTTLAITRGFSFCSLGKSTAPLTWCCGLVQQPINSKHSIPTRRFLSDKSEHGIEKDRSHWSVNLHSRILGFAKVWWYTSAPCKMNYVKMQHNHVSTLLIYGNMCNIIILTCYICMSTCNIIMSTCNNVIMFTCNLKYVTFQHIYAACWHE